MGKSSVIINKMTTKLIISVIGEDITKKPIYCGDGNLMEWKEKLGRKIRQKQKYWIQAISNEGPYGMSWFSIKSLVTTPKGFDDYSPAGGCGDKIQTIGFELTEKTKKILEDIILNND